MVIESNLLENIVQQSPRMREVVRQVLEVAATEVPVLVTGESGTGKELVARAIHESSRRAAGPFIPVHAGAIPRELIASELFGYDRGAFTGATRSKPGQLEGARGGTLFLDEISTMDERTQVSLLRVLETKRCERLGGSSFVELDFRLVAATNDDLAKEVREGRFRLDLYHRLSVYQIHLPPLRDRREDIIPLALRFLRHYAAAFGKLVTGFSLAALEWLCSHSWPGNVRELENAVQQAVILAGGQTVGLENLPADPVENDGEGQILLPLGSSLGEAERTLIEQTLHRVNGNKQRAAEMLGISRKGIYNKMTKYRISG